MPYHPFMIGDPSFGIVRDLESWIAPADAFRKLENAQIYRGRMQKRYGSKFFGRIARQVTAENIGTGDGGTKVFGGILANVPLILPDALNSIVVTAGAVTITSVTTLTVGVGGPVGFPQFGLERLFTQVGDGDLDIYPNHGFILVAFAVAPGSSVPITVKYDYVPRQANVTKTDVILGNLPADFLLGDVHLFQLPDVVDGIFLDGVAPQLTITIVETGTDTIVKNDETDLSQTGNNIGELIRISGPTVSASGSVNSRTGALFLAMSRSAANAGAQIKATYELHIGDPVIGIHTLVTETGAEELLAISHDDLYRYSTALKTFIHVGAGFTVIGPDDSVRTAIIQQESDKESVLAYVSETDRAKKYNLTGLTFTDIPNSIVDLSTPPVSTGTLDATKVILVHQGYVIYLSTKETIGADPQQDFRRRFRWARPLTQETLLENSFGDIPSQETIRGGAILRNEIYVFMDTEVWRLKFKDDFRAPFEPQIVSSGEGAVAKNGVSVLDRSIVVFSKTGLREFDGREMRRLGDVLGEIILDVDPGNADRIQSFRSTERRQFWFAYPEVGNTLPTRIVVVSEENGMYALWDSPGWRCFGKYSQQGSRLVDEITEIVDEIDWSLDSQVFVAGFPLTLAGKNNGEVHEIPGLTYSDDGADINFEIETQGLNPFLRQRDPRTARLGFLKIFGDALPGENLTVSFFRDRETRAYVTHTLPMDPKIAGEEKFWGTIDVGTVAYQHRINIQNKGKRLIALDAIVPYFAEGGRIDQL